MTELLTQLNPKQQQAVTAPAQNLLILAGAGSGKTRVLVQRIAYLIHQQQVSPDAILAVTFTNKAAHEMQHRIETLLALPVRGLWIGTFHRLAHRLLRIHWQDAKLAEHFQILDSDDQLRMIKRVLKESQLAAKEIEPKRVQWFINNSKDAGLRPQAVTENNSYEQTTLLNLYELYEQACERANVVDFAELLLRSYELLQNNAALCAHYQARFQYILVDEFQDTNSIQYAWLRLLAGEKANVMAVGDDDQSIYGWRGARVENILRFSKDYPDTLTIRLEQNYRSTATILSAANQLIDQNTERLGKDLWTAGEEGEKITVYSAFNDLEEARYIVSVVQQNYPESAYRDIAVLYRSNAQSRVLEEALLYAGIPYRVYGGLRFFDRAEIKDALSYLRLLNNLNDDAAMERVVNNPPRGIGERSLQLLRQQARETESSLWHTIQAVIADNSFSPRAHNALVSFTHLIETMISTCKDFSLGEMTEHVIHRSGLWDHYHKAGTLQAQSRCENLQELITASNEYSQSFYVDTDEDLGELDAFLAHAALEAGEQQADAASDCVQLMTLHTAKGLEFSRVIISGLEEGLFPHGMSISDLNRLEEERRLCYVGMTRAKHKLYLTHAQQRRVRGTDERRLPSRFINEIPAEYVHHERLSTTNRHFPRATPVRAARGAIADSQFSLGQTVNHNLFGSGIILNYEGQGETLRLQVEFTDGTKWLMPSYAKLS
jgi:ATP-dependent DNA helicase UvrD/PcrA